MAEQSFLAKLGMRTGTLGTTAALAIAFGDAGSVTPNTVHTDAQRVGMYADRTANAETLGTIVGGQVGILQSRSGSDVNVSVSGGLSVTKQITSSLAIGTAPFAITSTTLVPNLYVARAAVADSATLNANLTGPITSVGNATSIASQTGTGTKFVVDNSPTLITPNIGTPSAGVLTNCTGTAAGLTAGNVTTNANLTGPITSVGNATSIAAQTGTGTIFVMNTSPTLVTPLLGTPTSGVLTNCTGTAAGLTAGNVTTNANLTGPITSVGNATAIAAQTGTGTTFVMQGSPTLTTPVIGAATGTSLSVSGQFTSTLVSGTPPLVVASTTVVGNLNVSQLLGGTWAIPGTLGSTTPNTAAVTTLSTTGITSFGSGVKLSRTTFSNAATILTTASLYVAQIGTMSAARTATLPAAATAGAGAIYYIADESGTVTSTNKITVTRAGGDTINGGTTLSLTTAYGNTLLVSDGTSKWTAIGGNSSTALTSTFVGFGDTSNFLSGSANMTFDSTNFTFNLAAKQSYGTAVTAFGDSIMLGTGIGAAGSRIPNLTAAARGWTTLTNDSISGSQLVGQIAAATTGIYSIVVPTGSNYMILTGYNDMRYNGASSTAQTAYQQALYAALAWLAIPDSKKIYGQNALVVQGGSGWTNSASYSGALGVKSSTNGDTLTVSLRGSTILLGIGHKNAGTGTFTVTIDGSPATGSPFSCGGNWANNAITTGPEVIILSGLTNALHTVVLTVGGADVAQLDWCIGLGQDIETWNAPRVYVGNCLRMNATGYTLGAPFNNGSDAAVISFNSIISGVIAGLQAIGLQVFGVPASAVYNPDDGDVQADNIHPNTTGASRIANMFIQASESSNINYGTGASSIVGTANQIVVTTGAGTTTLSLASAITIAGGTVTSNAPMMNLTQTWNAGGVTFDGILLNITNTASAAASKLIDLQVAAASKFNVDTTGIAAARSFLVSTGLVGTSSLALDGATQTSNFPVITATQTWNAGGTTFTGILLNITNTASAAASRLFDLQIAAASKFYVDVGGVTATVVLTTAGLAGSSDLTLGGGTQTASHPVINATQTWNNGGVAFTGILLNITNTAGLATSRLLDLQISSVSKFLVDTTGLATAVSLATAGVAGTTALTVAGATQTTNVPFVSVTGTWNAAGVTFDAAFLLNVTDSASAATSKLIDLQVAASSKFNVNKAGLTTSITFASTATTDATTTATGSMVNSGGMGIAKAVFAGGTINANGAIAAGTQPAYIGAGTSTIVGTVADGFTSGVRLTPTYSAATVQTVTRHNYIDLNNPVLAGVGPAAVTDAAVFRFDAAVGTHKALDAGTTKITTGAVDGWEKRNVAGTIYYMPMYLSKTA